MSNTNRKFKLLESDDLYEIDLRKKPYERWSEVIKQENESASALAQTGWEEIKNGSRSASILAEILYRWYLLGSKQYRQEISAWADGLKFKRSRLSVLQWMYSLSQLVQIDRQGCYSIESLGCTTGTVMLEGQGMGHYRSLDWGTNEFIGRPIAESSRVFKFTDKDRYFYVVGLTGYVGALSGMVPRHAGNPDGGYSITINWAPPKKISFWFHEPAIYIRKILEQCNSYEEALSKLTNTKESRLSSSTFITLCGINQREACVIEYAKKRWMTYPKPRVRKADQTTGIISQANHYNAFSDIAGINDSVDAAEKNAENGNCAIEDLRLLASSRKRQALMQKLMQTNYQEGKTFEEGMTCLDESPIDNKETRQKMAFLPALDKIIVMKRSYEE